MIKKLLHTLQEWWNGEEAIARMNGTYPKYFLCNNCDFYHLEHIPKKTTIEEYKKALTACPLCGCDRKEK